MKRTNIFPFLVPVMLSGIFLLTGCSAKAPPEQAERTAKPVVVRTLAEETREKTLDYLGFVSTEDTRNLGFKTGGKLARIAVAKGDVVTAGMELAALDVSELQLGVDAASAQLAAARAQYRKAVNGAEPEDVENMKLNVQKAQDARDYAAELLAKTQTLFKEGAAAQAELDQVQLQLDVRESELQQAKALLSQVQSGARREDVQSLSAQVEQAQANLNLQSSMLGDAVLLADTNGTVLEVLYTEGELVGAGYPVVVIGNDVRTVTTGVTAKDSRTVTPGMKALIGDDSRKGRVLRVSEVPDPVTLTYEVELAVELEGSSTTESLIAGEVANVRFVTDQVRGIWIPLTAVSVEGDRHVFLARDGVAIRVPVTLLDTVGMQVQVEGLSDGDQLILEGVHRLSEGDLLSVAQEEAGS